MFPTAARLLLRKAVERHPHCPPDDANAFAIAIVEALRTSQGLTADELWARMSDRGMRSATNMRHILYWMRQEKLLKVESPSPRSIVRYFRLALHSSTVKKRLEEIRERDTKFLSLSRQEQAQLDYDERKPLKRSLTYWDL